jgi:hypothetical protein
MILPVADFLEFIFTFHCIYFLLFENCFDSSDVSARTSGYKPEYPVYINTV